MVTYARPDVDLTGRPSRATYTLSSSCLHASKPSDSNCVTAHRGSASRGPHQSTFCHPLLSCTLSYVSGMNAIAVCANRVIHLTHRKQRHMNARRDPSSTASDACCGMHRKREDNYHRSPSEQVKFFVST